MNSYVFPPRDPIAVPVANTDALFPVNRIFCVGRNYAAHAQEMGHEVDREAPFYFTKSAQAVVLSDARLPYPPGTADFHHEMELVVALGASGFEVSEAEAEDMIFAYGCGLDMTRRDLQQAGKDKRRPWSLGKDFEGSAVLASITRTEDFNPVGSQTIRLSVNGEIRQQARLSDMVWKVPEVISHLSRYYHLQPGDLIMTGTPAGVGPVHAGDRIEGTIDGLTPVSLTLSA